MRVGHAREPRTQFCERRVPLLPLPPPAVRPGDAVKVPCRCRVSAVRFVHMDQCTLGALRTRSDRDLVGPKISIAVRRPLTDPPRSTKEARMEQERRKTGCHSDGRSCDAQPGAAATDAGAHLESGREKPEQSQQESASGEQGGRPESVPAIEFSFEGRVVRTAVKGGQTWFVAADVCAVLEHVNSRDAISRLDDDEKGVAIIDTLGGAQEMNVVNESGVYNLIFTSRKPQA